MLAAHKGDLAPARLLLAAGADVGVRKGKENLDAADIAAYWGRGEELAALETGVGARIPGDLRAHLARYGGESGAPFSEYEGLGAEAIASTWRGLADLREKGTFDGWEPRELPTGDQQAADPATDARRREPRSQRRITLGPMAVLYLLLAYLLASLPVGVILGVIYADVDPREGGSGNIGATNVHRLLGWKLAAATLAGDAFKGFLPVALAGSVHPGPRYAAMVALAAFAGHCWSAFLDFRGGKGVATAAGALLALAPLPTLIALVAWAGVRAITGRSSLASLLAAALTPLLVGLLAPQHLAATFLLALGVVARHRDNIRRLRAGQEH